MTALQGRGGRSGPPQGDPCPGGTLLMQAAPDALHVIPPHADTGLVDDAPTAGAVGLTQLAVVVH
eukprot:15436807-Alexandrium_andersonii.AAC.1